MATQTLIQYLDRSGKDALGNVLPTSAASMNRSQTEIFLVGDDAVAQGDWVKLDFLAGATTPKLDSDRALYVIPATAVATHGNGQAFGVALHAAAPGEKVEVVIAGYVEGSKVDGAVAEGDLLVGPIGTAGEADPFVPGTTEGRIIGLALEADTAGRADCIVFKTF